MDHPVRLEIAVPDGQARLTVLSRPLLALPALVFASVLAVVLVLLGLFGWVAALALGRLPVGIHELGTYCLRYQAQTLAYALLLTSRYPSLTNVPTTRD